MKDNSWLILAIRLIGLFVLVQLLPGIVSRTFWAFGNLRLASPEGGGSWAEPAILLSIAGVFATIVLEISMCCYLFFGGGRLARYMLRDARLRCPGCARPTGGSDSGPCPECGSNLSAPSQGA